ncbi:anti-sigma factor antagonist [Streptomyces albofaciens JCM 4342]|uniref:STAS domain-containing protein n=1 Tax=Streptomyces albofaciens TaxID=66866 RepID=UPI00123ACB01|nr:STAS domain-containing protein [Streptomyces albofaciens]KAA6213230.1 anti-sigma factor antagonist [Streptomyces albofaciens JCM 4342]
MSLQTDRSSQAGPDALGVRTRLFGSSAVLTVRGEIDYGTVPVLDQAVAELPSGLGSVVLEMTGVTFMDAAGLHFLRRLDAYGRRRQIPVRALNLRRQPRRVLELARTWPGTPRAEKFFGRVAPAGAPVAQEPQ